MQSGLILGLEKIFRLVYMDFSHALSSAFGGVNLQSSCRCAILCVACVRLWQTGSPASAFGVVGQSHIKEKQEREGLAFRTPAFDGTELSEAGKTLLNKISGAKEWGQVERILRKYDGNEIQVFNSAMYKALSLRRYRQGAEVYSRLCNLNISRQSATFTAAMTIHSRMGNSEAVDQIWKEALNTCGIDAVLASARIRAAATDGDVETAARTLDQLNCSNFEVDIGHVTSAIRACCSDRGFFNNTAKYLFYNVLPQFNLQPNIITFNCFIGALQSGPL